MEKLKSWRKSHGVTQSVLAEKAGTSQSQIVKFENGSSRPGLDIARRIEDITNGEVTAAELLGLVPGNVRDEARKFDHAVIIKVELSKNVIKDAAKFGLDAEVIARVAVEEKVKAARLKAWVVENKLAFDTHARDIGDNGLWSDGLRHF